MNRYDIALGKPVIQKSICDSPTVPDAETLLENIEKFGAENYPELKRRLMLKALGVPALMMNSVAGSGSVNITSTPNSEVNQFFDLWQDYQYFEYRTMRALNLPDSPLVLSPP